jgi:hypothetical protein
MTHLNNNTIQNTLFTEKIQAINKVTNIHFIDINVFYSINLCNKSN